MNFNFLGEGNQFWANMLISICIFGGAYLIIFRPQQKKKKQEEAMRRDLQICDEITTIGGIVGKVISIKNDTQSLIIETSIDRSKLHIKDWAIASRDNVRPDEATEKNSKTKTK